MNETGEWLKAGGISIDSATILVELKVGRFAELLDAVALRKIAAARAEREGIVIPAADLERALSAFYTERSLFEPEQIEEWHRSLPLEKAALRDFLREQLLHDRLGECLVPEPAVVERFGANPHEHARAEVNVFTFATAGAAREFILAVKEGEVRPHGEAKQITRRDAPPEIAAELFTALPGDLVGPMETEDRRHAVYRLVHRQEAKLDDALKAQIRREMLAEILKAELSRQPRSFLL